MSMTKKKKEEEEEQEWDYGDVDSEEWLGDEDGEGGLLEGIAGEIMDIVGDVADEGLKELTGAFISHSVAFMAGLAIGWEAGVENASDMTVVGRSSPIPMPAHPEKILRRVIKTCPHTELEFTVEKGQIWLKCKECGSKRKPR